MTHPAVQFWMMWGLLFCPYLETIEPWFEIKEEENEQEEN